VPVEWADDRTEERPLGPGVPTHHVTLALSNGCKPYYANHVMLAAFGPSTAAHDPAASSRT